MRLSATKIVVFGVFIVLSILAYLLFTPRSYLVPPMKTRPDIRYWDLPTGSRIAWYRIPAKGTRKPFPVIFLQGGPGTPVYQRNIENLSPLAEDGYDVYLYDLAGCGHSGRFGKIADYTAERHASDLAAILRKIGAQKVILIGQSWGACLGTLFMSQHPGMVEKAVFTGPGPLLPINNELSEVLPPGSLLMKTNKSAIRDERKRMYTLRARLVEYCARSMDMKLASDQEMDAFLSRLNYELGRFTVCDTNNRDIPEAGSGFYCQVKTVQSFPGTPDVRKKLKGCTTPVLILRGQCDHIRWGFVAEYLELFQHHTLVIVPGAGHVIPLEKPLIYRDAIRAFLHDEPLKP